MAANFPDNLMDLFLENANNRAADLAEEIPSPDQFEYKFTRSDLYNSMTSSELIDSIVNSVTEKLSATSSVAMPEANSEILISEINVANLDPVSIRAVQMADSYLLTALTDTLGQQETAENITYGDSTLLENPSLMSGNLLAQLTDPIQANVTADNLGDDLMAGDPFQIWWSNLVRNTSPETTIIMLGKQSTITHY